MSDDTYTYERAGFAERLGKLAGKVQQFEAAGGTRSGKPRIPDEHAICMALAFGRRGVRDVGPEIAQAIYAGHAVNRERVVAELVHAMLIALPKAKRYPHTLPLMAGHAYILTVAPVDLEPPVGVRNEDYRLLVDFARAMLWQAADESLRLAERAYYLDEEKCLARRLSAC